MEACGEHSGVSLLCKLSIFEYPEGGYMAVGSFLFLKEQIKGIIIMELQI
jgi:hypothetical protein